MRNTKHSQKSEPAFTDCARSVLDMFNQYHRLLADLRQMAARIDVEILHALERRAAKAMPEAIAIIASKPPMRWPGAPSLVPVLIPGEQILTEPVPGWHKMWAEQIRDFDNDLIQMLFGAYMHKMTALEEFLKGMWNYSYSSSSPSPSWPVEDPPVNED